MQHLRTTWEDLLLQQLKKGITFALEYDKKDLGDAVETVEAGGNDTKNPLDNGENMSVVQVSVEVTESSHRIIYVCTRVAKYKFN